MEEAAIVSTAGTPIGPAFRSALDSIRSPTLAGHAICTAVQRSGVDPAEIEDVVLGSALTAGTGGLNIARLFALAGELPVTAAARRWIGNVPRG